MCYLQTRMLYIDTGVMLAKYFYNPTLMYNESRINVGNVGLVWSSINVSSS